MPKEPLVSIIINTHNDTKYLNEAIKSALSQTYTNTEIILFDNASNVDIRASIGNYLEKIKYFRSEEFLTLGAARNSAITHSNGELITFLDADDIFLENKLDKQIPCFIDKDVGLVYSNTYHMSKKNSKWVDEKLHTARMPEDKIFSELLKTNFIPFNTAIIRKSCLSQDQHYWFNENFNFCTDYELFLRISHDFKVCYVNEILGKWRIHGENYTLKKPYLASAERYLMIPRILEFEPELFNKHKKEMDIYLSEVFLDMGRYFMHINRRSKAIICVIISIINSFNGKNIKILFHYLFPFINRMRLR